MFHGSLLGDWNRSKMDEHMLMRFTTRFIHKYQCSVRLKGGSSLGNGLARVKVAAKLFWE